MALRVSPSPPGLRGFQRGIKGFGSMSPAATESKGLTMKFLIIGRADCCDTPVSGPRGVEPVRKPLGTGAAFVRLDTVPPTLRGGREMFGTLAHTPNRKWRAPVSRNKPTRHFRWTLTTFSPTE